VSYILTELDNYANPTGIVAVCTRSTLSCFICPALSCFSPAV